jgi:hypothetical protein
MDAMVLWLNFGWGVVTLFLHILILRHYRKLWLSPPRDNGYRELQKFFNNEEWSACCPCLAYLPHWRIQSIRDFFLSSERSDTLRQRLHSDLGHSMIGALNHFDARGNYGFSIFGYVVGGLCILRFSSAGSAVIQLPIGVVAVIITTIVGHLILIGFMIHLRRQVRRLTWPMMHSYHSLQDTLDKK